MLKFLKVIFIIKIFNIMKKEKKKKIITIALSLTVIGLTTVAFAQTPFQEERIESRLKLLTEPYLRIDAETDINAPLNLKDSLNFISSAFRGQINVADLSDNRTYVLPNISGEICLSAGNCLLSPQGTINRLAKFTAQGIANSSIQDFFQGTSIFINEQGNVGVGTNSPQDKLHVTGGIRASDDICTDLQGGKCLSDLESAAPATAQTRISGEGVAERIPLWRERLELGSSEIYQSGRNIGIGTTPAYKLDVSGTVRMLGFRMPVSPTEGYGLMSDEHGFGTWQPVLTPLAAGRDIAENFLIDPKCKNSNNCPEPGDLVSINENKFIEKSSVPYDQKIIGVVSTNPAMTLGKEIDSSFSKPIALIGQVPVKVSLENGPIEIGDMLTSSIFPGIAKKANQTGRVVGMALESLSEDDFKNCDNNSLKNSKIFDCEKKIGKITVLINLHNALY